MDDTRYDTQTTSAAFQGKPIPVTHLTPILTPERMAKRKREIENQLYDVFSKYHKGSTLLSNTDSDG